VGADGYGHYKTTASSATVRVLSGCLKVRQLRFRPPSAKTKPWQLQVNGQSLPVVIQDGFLVADLPTEITVATGSEIKLR